MCATTASGNVQGKRTNQHGAVSRLPARVRRPSAERYGAAWSAPSRPAPTHALLRRGSSIHCGAIAPAARPRSAQLCPRRVHTLRCLPLQVLLHVKRSEKEGFLYNVPAATEVDVVVRELVKVHNLRGRVNRLAAAAGELSLYGPMKLPEQQGLDDATPLLEEYDVKTGKTEHKAPVHGANYRQDPSERRTGDAPSDELAAVISRTVEDAKALTSDKLVQQKRR